MSIDDKDREEKSKEEVREVDRVISTGKLSTLLHLHIQPINQVVYLGPDREISS